MQMFNAPSIITDIPDIKTIYDINDDQGEELDEAVSRLDDNIFLDDMHEEQIVRWEKILHISPASDDTIEDRRFRVKTKVLERLPYSYRVILNKLETLCPNGYELVVNDNRDAVTIYLSLRSLKMLADVNELMDKILPLNMIFEIIILYNTYGTYSTWTHEEMHPYTHDELHYNVWD